MGGLSLHPHWNPSRVYFFLYFSQFMRTNLSLRPGLYSEWVGQGRRASRLSSSSPPPPHKFRGATSAQLPGPRAACALSWGGEGGASSKQRAAGSLPAPGLWARPRRPVCLRGAPARQAAGEAGSTGWGGQLWPGQPQSRIQTPDPQPVVAR